MEAQLEEVVPFLSHERADVRLTAVDALLSYSTSEAAKSIIQRSSTLSALANLIKDAEKTCTAALTILVNITSEVPETRSVLASTNAVPYAVSVTCASTSTKSESGLAAKLLVNLTLAPEGCNAVQESTHRLAERFVSSDNLAPTLAFVFLNLSQLPVVRQEALLRTSGEVVLKRLLPALLHANRDVRFGIAGVIRNCCVEQERHAWLVSTKCDIIPPILTALIDGRMELDDDDLSGMPKSAVDAHRDISKKYESDEQIRAMLIEIIHFLSSTEESRATMENIQVYPVLRELEKIDDSEEVQQKIHDAVYILMQETS